jgi:hypothetical protein
MRVREAVEADAGRMAAIADAPADMMRNLVHDRTVRVAEAEPTDVTDPNDDASDEFTGKHVPGEDPEESDLLGFVSFDAREGVVHVTQVEGTQDACERLLGEPVRFARQEGMSVELLVPDDERSVCSAAETVGFDEFGPGPRFEGRDTVRYRMDQP